MKKLLDIAGDIAGSDKEREHLDLSKREFSVLWTLRENGLGGDLADMAKTLYKLLDENKTWVKNRKKEMELRRSV